jgi:hypothetical protein
MRKKNIAFGLAGLLSVIIGFAGKTIYRDFVLNNGISDLGLAGFLPSFFYVTGFSLLLLMRPKKYPVTIIILVTTGSVLYEIMQYYNSSHLDIKDIIASLTGGFVAFIILRVLDRIYQQKDTE